MEVVIEARASAVQLGISPYDTGAWMTFVINGNGLAEDEGKGTEKRKRGVESDLGGDTSTCATVVEDEVKAAPVGASLEATEQAWADYQSFWGNLGRSTIFRDIMDTIGARRDIARMDASGWCIHDGG